MTEATEHTCMQWRRKWQPTPVFLPGESQGQRSLVGCHLWDRTESDMTEATQPQQQHTHTHTHYLLFIHSSTDGPLGCFQNSPSVCVCVCVCVCAQFLSCVQLFVTPWTIAHQAPLSMGYHNKNTGVGCHFLLQGDLSDPGIEPLSPASPALAGGFFTTEPHGKPFSWILLPQN